MSIKVSCISVEIVNSIKKTNKNWNLILKRESSWVSILVDFQPILGSSEAPRILYNHFTKHFWREQYEKKCELGQAFWVSTTGESLKINRLIEN